MLVSDDSKVEIKGATKLGVEINTDIDAKIAEGWKTKNDALLAKWSNAGAFYAAAEPVAKALAARLQAVGIHPVLECNNPQVLVSRQAWGDIEYLFAVNAAYDEKAGGMNSIKATSAYLSFPNDGRPLYDAVRGSAAGDLVAQKKSDGKSIIANVRMGAGHMRVYARTARPIGGVRLSAPTVYRDYTLAQNPLRARITATLVDNAGGVLAGSAPLQITVTDPLGDTRYDLYRATDQGSAT